MKKRFGIWLPDADEHFEGMMRRADKRHLDGRLVGTYQHEKVNLVIAACKKRRVAVDIGAHVGLWSMWLAESFREVVAFEPVPEHVACFEENVAQSNVKLYPVALGEKRGSIELELVAHNSGQAHVGQGWLEVEMIALDDLLLDKVDLIKIDVEGYEPQVLAGAMETIERCRPLVVVEQKGHHERYGNSPTAALDALVNVGMTVHEVMGGDYLLRWKKEKP